MKPTEHETITGEEADRLPSDSVIRAHPESVSACGAYGIWPLTRILNVWTYGHGFELKGPLAGKFLILYVPEPALSAHAVEQEQEHVRMLREIAEDMEEVLRLTDGDTRVVEVRQLVRKASSVLDFMARNLEDMKSLQTGVDLACVTCTHQSRDHGVAGCVRCNCSGPIVFSSQTQPDFPGMG